MTKPPIVIVGAGPTGLLLACQLAMRNIDFRIIDKTDDHTTQSRAIVIHACKNVFVTDGACMTSTSTQNPSLTYMALTARAADYAMSELKKGNL